MSISTLSAQAKYFLISEVEFLEVLSGRHEIISKRRAFLSLDDANNFRNNNGRQASKILAIDPNGSIAFISK